MCLAASAHMWSTSCITSDIHCKGFCIFKQNNIPVPRGVRDPLWGFRHQKEKGTRRVV